MSCEIGITHEKTDGAVILKCKKEHGISTCDVKNSNYTINLYNNNYILEDVQVICFFT